VRIISGSKRGSKIKFPAVRGLRPSGDRIRETLFAWLQTSVAGSQCLDMFAGSGALGFEAASRGADRVVMIEKNRSAAESLKENIERLQFDNVDIVAADALARSTYELKPAMHQLQKLLKPDALVYVETGKKCNSLEVPVHWQLFREKVAGEVQIHLYRTIAAE